MANDSEGFLTEVPHIPDEEFCIFGTVHAYPEHADKLEAVYAETTRLSQSETGIIHYCLGRDPDDPNVFHFYERYTGRKAFEEHNSQPIVQKLLADKLFRGVKAKIVRPIAPAT